ncbi:MAG: hypothetical protein SD837_16645 [Candidatus Electrothrix scaldis]|nr:MAG: hypothetical protein SD837_16645 [Candidatus Electrothrix sp. GW3-3]
MKKILCITVLMILFGAGIAQANWQDDFVSDYDEFGMSVAVEEALHNDITPDEILSFIISHSEKFQTKVGLKALYCAGADRDAVREAANKLGITVEDLSVALEESIAECGDKKTLSDRDLFDGGPGKRLGLSDRDLIDGGPGRRLGLGDRELVPIPEHVTLPEHVDPPTRPRPASPSSP